MSEPGPASLARGLIRSLDRASLGTLMRPDAPDAGSPYTSLVLVACDHDSSPILLVSTLADHTKNLAVDPRVSLLFDGTLGLDEPLTGPRVSVQGRATKTEDERLKQRFVARHPGSAMYAGFKDFAFWTVSVTRAHLVAGFGRIHWFNTGDILYPPAPALQEAEADIIEHMNRDHVDAVQLYATKLLGREGDGWTLTGVDPEGADLRRGGTVLRLPFAKPVTTAEEARVELVRLVKQARSA